MQLKQVLQDMWIDYVKISPAAGRIHKAFEELGEVVVNDHIALRTLRHPKVGVDHLARTFEACGYKRIKDYHFKEKKLYAWHFEHSDPIQPKVFISELLVDQFSKSLQKTMHELVESIEDKTLGRPDFSWIGRPWTLTHKSYLDLAKESEYASWVAAFGFRPNHFTVSVNHLKKLISLNKVNAFIKELGQSLNENGGEIKGSAQEFLEQSSTMAENIFVSFSDGQYPVPGCYYEFALRYKLPNGNLYQGFVAASADKIFESTNRRQ